MHTISRQTRLAPDRLSDAEIAFHIAAAIEALNSTLEEAAKVNPLFAYDGNPRYEITLSPHDLAAARGIATLNDRQTEKCHDVRVCFGVGVSDVQLKREFFEDVPDTEEVRVKLTSKAGLFRAFLTFLRELQNPREPGSWTFGPSDNERRLVATAS